MLIEQGFHTNAAEVACIKRDDWHKKIAEKQAKAFADFFGLKLKTAAPKTLYRVQVGAFSVKANAEKLANELKSKGYSAIIKEG
jgi:N-acetylmuramoyl-L-alanine amidase